MQQALAVVTCVPPDRPHTSAFSWFCPVCRLTARATFTTEGKAHHNFTHHLWTAHGALTLEEARQ